VVGVIGGDAVSHEIPHGVPTVRGIFLMEPGHSSVPAERLRMLNNRLRQYGEQLSGYHVFALPIGWQFGAAPVSNMPDRNRGRLYVYAFNPPKSSWGRPKSRVREWRIGIH
jgi:hypothetical protein